MDCKQKLEQCILDCSNTVFKNCEEYQLAVSKGQSHIKLFVAHVTTVKNIKHAEIEDTDTYKMDPSIKSKLHFTIVKEIEKERTAIQQILDVLEKIQSGIVRQCDKVFMCRNSMQNNLSLKDITECSETSCCISEKIEALDIFKRKFIDNHHLRMLSIEYCDVGGNLDKLLDFWKSSDMESFLQVVKNLEEVYSVPAELSKGSKPDMRYFKLTSSVNNHVNFNL